MPTNVDICRPLMSVVGPSLAGSRCRPGTEVGPVPMYVVGRRWADGKFILGERVANPTDDEVPSPSSPQPSASSAISATSQGEKNNSVNYDCYDTPSIIRERRRCKRGKTVEQLIDSLLQTGKCSDKDFLVGHDVGKWLIENCTRKNFPTADEIMKMIRNPLTFTFQVHET